MRPMLSAFMISLVLSTCAVAQQRDYWPRDDRPNAKPARIAAQAPKQKGPPIETEKPRPPDQPPVAEASPPQPPQPTIVVPAPQVTIMGPPPQGEGWLGWALFALGLLFTGVFATQTWLGRHGLQFSVDYDRMFEDTEFKKRLARYISEHSEENAVQQLLNRIEARAAAPALSSSTSKRGEH